MRIGMCGTVSVGKTTLVNALKKLEQFEGYEFATERSKYLKGLGIPLNTDSTLKGQTVFLAERCTELIHENVITDRTIIDVMAFTQNAESIDYKDKEYFNEYAVNFLKEYDYIFYISPEGIDIEDNGIRETNANYRISIDNTITHLTRTYGHRIKNLHMLKGTTNERIEQMLGFIQL